VQPPSLSRTHQNCYSYYFYFINIDVHSFRFFERQESMIIVDLNAMRFVMRRNITATAGWFPVQKKKNSMRSIEFELNLTYRIGISTGIVPCVWFAYVRAYWWCTSKRRGWSEPIAVERIWLRTGRGIHLLRRNHDERDCLHLVSCYESINQSINQNDKRHI
jgi:hypothetical protein